MKIYYNRYYSSSPYVGFGTENCFGTVCCGSEGLLSIMMLHGGIVRSGVSSEDRKTFYHNNMQRCIKASDPFWESFRLDSFATSNAVLAWRDALVAAGWDLNSGSTPKLQFIRDAEPAMMPHGSADYWNRVLRMSAGQLLFPEGTEIVVTQSKESVEPKIAALLDNQARLGLSVDYQPDMKAVADGNLGKIQRWFLNGQKDRIKLDEADDTFVLLHFDNEETALRYVATQPADRWALYHCRQPKLFDNTLRLLRQPVCGSSMDNCEPQVVQLFMLGNGLFEFPLNLNRILAWLNAPIHPLGHALRRRLARVLASSGGICNEEWNQTVEEYIAATKDKNASSRIDDFLPFQKRQSADRDGVESFNKALRHWAVGLLSMEKFPYDEIVREQLRQIDTYCTALLNILQERSQGEIPFVELQRWCRSIVTPKSYTQYEAQQGCRSVITAEGDIHSVADSLVWLCIEESGAGAWPFDFLKAQEYDELQRGGAYLYDKTFHSRIGREAMVQTLLRTRRLTIVECAKMGGEPLRRHPLMLQLNEAVEGGLKQLFVSPQLPEEALAEDQPVNNRSDETVLQLKNDVCLRQRHEKEQAESYSSLDLLIQHPFDYVCQYNAALGDVGTPTMDDRDRTMGNVAHAIIERVFKGTTRAEQEERIKNSYEKIFDEAVDSTGLLLRQREYAIELKDMRKRMKDALSRLLKIIIDNGLTVDDCEYAFRTAGWVEAGDGVQLASRADMLLTDGGGDKVIFDFKWSDNRRSYEQRVQSNTALQLEIYKYLAEKEFERSVRTAYILLPEVHPVSKYDFVADGFQPVVPDSSADVMRLAANAYAFRQRQFAEGRIERAEGHILSESEYGAEQDKRTLYPLKKKDGVVSKNKKKYSNFEKLR